MYNSYCDYGCGCDWVGYLGTCYWVETVVNNKMSSDNVMMRRFNFDDDIDFIRGWIFVLILNAL